MTNEKLNTQYLINEISIKSGETKKDTDLFLKDFIALIQDILLKEKTVKIKGLGTFKLSWNKSRKSVNIQTGLDFEIAGHHKVVFTPENELKDLVNEPYAHLQTVMLDETEEYSPTDEVKVDPIKNFSTKAQEIASIISEMKSTPEIVPETIVEPPITEQTKVEPENNIIENKTEVTSDIPNNNFIPQKEMKEEELPNAYDQTHDTSRNQVSSNSQNATNSQNNEENDNMNEKPKKKSSGWKWFFTILFLLAAAFAVCWFFVPDCELVKFVKTEFNINNQPIIAAVDSSLVDTDEFVNLEIDSTNIDSDHDWDYNEESSQPALSFSFNVNDYVMQEAIARKGTRLAWFSSVYYGSYMFWPYIYLANKDQIANPDEIELGQRIKIPKLPSEMIDVNNPEAIGRVKYIEEHLREY